MKLTIGSIVGTLGGALVLISACGGTSFEGSNGVGGVTGGGDAATGDGGKTNAGTTSGGSASGSSSAGDTSSAGSESGGTASAGSPNGGTASAGAPSGGTASGGHSTGGVSSGGASGGSGGVSMTCKQDSDCVACAFPTAPTNTTECYCARCAGTPMLKKTCEANQAAWEDQCSAIPLPCPAIACVVPPVPRCKSNMCVAGN